MPGTFSPSPRVSDPDMHPGTCVTHVPWCMSGSLTSGFLWSRVRGKRSRHSRRMRNPPFYVSGKRPIQEVREQYQEVGRLKIPWRAPRTVDNWIFVRSTIFYRQLSHIRRTKSQNLNVFRLVLQLSLPNSLKLLLSREWRCNWGSDDRQCSNYI